jgi:CMP-N,N'-diacetyllegionaminic acid synthase
MIRDKKILALVPARGGSKGIKLKNLQEISGKSLVQITAEFIQSCPHIDHGILSTDHEQIAQVGTQYGLEVPFLRPDNLSGDFVGDRELLAHICSDYSEISDYDILVYLQPTSPLRTNDMIRECIEAITEDHYQSSWTVSEVPKKYHPLKVLTEDHASLSYFDKEGEMIIARQQLSPSYIRNGLCYAWDLSYLRERKNPLLAPKTKKILIKRPVANIDTLEDLHLAERLFKEL